MRVLIADDNVDLAESIAAVLRSRGSDARVCEDGGEAIASVECWQPDVLLVDLKLPVRSGLEVLEAVRDAPLSRIIAMTGYDTAENIRAAEAEGAYERVVPPVSLLAEFPVALVQKVAEERGTTDVAKAYLEFLYSKEAQEIIASFNNRVHNPEVVAATADQFPEVRLITVEDVFGSWAEAQETHFGDGGTLDEVFRN